MPRKSPSKMTIYGANYAALADHKVTWHWVKGHSGNVGNEKADMLANQGMDAHR